MFGDIHNFSPKLSSAVLVFVCVSVFLNVSFMLLQDMAHDTPFLCGSQLPVFFFLHSFFVKLPPLPPYFSEIFPTPPPLLLKIKSPLQQKFPCNSPHQTNFFNNSFFFSFTLKVKEK